MENWTNVDDEKFGLEVEDHMNCVKKKLKSTIEEILSDVYTDIIPYAYGDALTNFRNAMANDLITDKPCLYGTRQAELRQKIWETHKSEIVELLNQDLLKEHERLNRLVDEYKMRPDYRQKFK